MDNIFAFTRDTRMAEVIHKDYRLIPILARFGIKLGFGNKSIGEICTDLEINSDFFLDIINSYYNKSYISDCVSVDYSAGEIIDYLLKTHKYYLNTKIPQIELYIQEMVIGSEDEDNRNLNLIKHFFKEYKEEIQVHFKVEETVVFPYILSLEDVFLSGNCDDNCDSELSDKIKKCPIEIYERNHDDLELKLGDMKNLIIRFLPPIFSDDLCERLLTELFRMESDLKEHARIEEKVLVPRVKFLENKVLDICGIYK